MRAIALDAIKQLNINGYRVSAELPFTTGDTPLFIRNLKTIYVDEADTSQANEIVALNGLNIGAELTTVRVFFTTDAKTQNQNFNAVRDSIKGVKEAYLKQGFFRREAFSEISYEGDNIVVTIELQLTKFI
jgi:hypothetical protein